MGGIGTEYVNEDNTLSLQTLLVETDNADNVHQLVAIVREWTGNDTKLLLVVVLKDGRVFKAVLVHLLLHQKVRLVQVIL